MSDANQIVNSIQEYFINVFRYKYTRFQDRARRKEFWMFALCSFIFSLVIQIIPILGQILGILYSLAVIVPGTCLGIRRLHDIGKSGWWMLLAFIPLIGAIVLIVWACQDSQPGENQYGPNPKGI